MKILILLLFILSLPVYGQGRWVGKKDFDNYKYDSGSFMVESQPWIVALAIEEWANNQKFFKIRSKELTESKTIDGSWDFSCYASSNYPQIRGSLMGDFDTTLRRAYLIPDTTLIDSLVLRANKEFNLVIFFSKRSQTETRITLLPITTYLKSFNPNGSSKVEMEMQLLAIYNDLKRRVLTFIELY